MFDIRRSAQVLLLLTAIVLLALIAWSSTQKNSPFYQPIQAFELVSSVNQVTPQEIQKTVEPYLGKSFWDIPLNLIQADLVRLDWIESAEVKRKWPNLLYIWVKEQVPVARWGEAGLVNQSGQVFFPLSIEGFENLVRLNGALDESEDVLRNLIALQKSLTALELMIEEINLSADKVWHIQILNGPKIVLDSLDYEHKLQRFIMAYPKLESDMRKSARVYDLRYSNGFIIAQK